MKKHITKLIGIALVAFCLLGCDDDGLKPQDPGQMASLFTQNNLLISYRVKAHDLLYNLTYEFRLDGKVGKRTANRGNTSDISVYHYY